MTTTMDIVSNSSADGNVLESSTPQELGPLELSQVTLPSTEVPASPIDPNQSFKTEVNEERAATTVIPSSLTPPPSTQVAASPTHARRTYSNSQQSNLFSPPATILNNLRERDLADYATPTSSQVAEASADELRIMLQACIADNQKMKTETAHHKLQYNLLSLQADEDSKRAVVEHDMIQRQVDALRMVEHTRQARRELSTVSDTTHAKYLEMKMMYDAAADEVQTLRKRLNAAKKVIQKKDEENITLTEKNEVLLNRIRENREHFHMLVSPGGIFHGALTPKQTTATTPQQYRTTPRQTVRNAAMREPREGEHGLSALLQAMSQDNQSAPSTPRHSHKAIPRQMGRHNRNAQSMSSLPTTPRNNHRAEHAVLLPSVDLVPQTEPTKRYSRDRFVPTTPVPKSERRRKSRESTISIEDTEELARQALESVAAAHSFFSNTSSQFRRSRGAEEVKDKHVYDSQASRAATAMLRRDPRQSFEVRDGATEKSANLQAKLFSGSGSAREPVADKRKFVAEQHQQRDEPTTAAKKMRVFEGDQAGLGIHFD